MHRAPLSLQSSVMLVWLWLLVLIALVLGVVRPARAQSVSTAVNLGWTAPTANTDGSKITGTLAYNVYQGPSAGPFVKALTGLTGTSATITSLAAGTCFAVSAVETLGKTSTESALTTTACAIVPDSPPGGLTVTITLTVK